ncbi:MAG: hypothetical protein ACYDCQ_06575, partial [Dehalococcoidia bacterium]
LWDAVPQVFPPRAHLLLGAVPLGLVAIASLIYQATKRPRPLEVTKAVVLAAAFLCWAANQLLPDIPGAMLLNDLAIALFVLDVFLTIVGWPPSLRRDAFTQTRVSPELQPRSGSTNGTSAVHATDAEHPRIPPTNPQH